MDCMRFAGLEITGGHHCRGETFQSIFWKVSPPQWWPPVISSPGFESTWAIALAGGFKSIHYYFITGKVCVLTVFHALAKMSCSSLEITVGHHLWKSVFEYNFQLHSWKLYSKTLFHRWCPTVISRLGCWFHLIELSLFLHSMTCSSLLFRTCVNGQVVTDRTLLRHGDRILWGNNHFFRINCPRANPTTAGECFLISSGLLKLQAVITVDEKSLLCSDDHPLF